jgi:hypothetical protein
MITAYIIWPTPTIETSQYSPTPVFLRTFSAKQLQQKEKIMYNESKCQLTEGLIHYKEFILGLL